MQVMIRTLLATHSKRDGNVGTELLLHDLVWIVAALAPRGTPTDPYFSLIPANNVARQQAAQDFVDIKGSQAIIRKLLYTMHDRRDRHAGTDAILQDLIWILAALGTRGYKC